MARDFGGATGNCFEYTGLPRGVAEPVPPPLVADVPTAPPSLRPSVDAAVGEHAAFA